MTTDPSRSVLGAEAEKPLSRPRQDRGGGLGDRIGWDPAALGVFGAEGSGFVGIGVPEVSVALSWYGHMGRV